MFFHSQLHQKRDQSEVLQDSKREDGVIVPGLQRRSQRVPVPIPNATLELFGRIRIETSNRL